MKEGFVRIDGSIYRALCAQSGFSFVGFVVILLLLGICSIVVGDFLSEQERPKDRTPKYQFRPKGTNPGVPAPSPVDLAPSAAPSSAPNTAGDNPKGVDKGVANQAADSKPVTAPLVSPPRESSPEPLDLGAAKSTGTPASAPVRPPAAARPSSGVVVPPNVVLPEPAVRISPPAAPAVPPAPVLNPIVLIAKPSEDDARVQSFAPSTESKSPAPIGTTAERSRSPILQRDPATSGGSPGIPERSQGSLDVGRSYESPEEEQFVDPDADEDFPPQEDWESSPPPASRRELRYPSRALEDSTPEQVVEDDSLEEAGNQKVDPYPIERFEPVPFRHPRQ